MIILNYFSQASESLTHVYDFQVESIVADIRESIDSDTEFHLNFSNSLLILAVRAAIAEKKIDSYKIKFTHDGKKYIILPNGRLETYPPCMFEEYIDKILEVKFGEFNP